MCIYRLKFTKNLFPSRWPENTGYRHDISKTVRTEMSCNARHGTQSTFWKCRAVHALNARTVYRFTHTGKSGHRTRVTTTVTGQLADTPTRGLPTRGLDKSRTGQLAVSYAAKRSKTKHGKSPVASASCPVRDLSTMRDVQSASRQSASCQSASWRIRELSSNHLYRCTWASRSR